jgi:ankyrin repeat protein
LNIPLIKSDRVDVDALYAQVNWEQISAFELLVLTFQKPNWAKLIDELREYPALAKLTWENGENLLCIAAHDNQPELVRLLVEFGADINTSGPFGNSLWCSVWGGNPETVALLLAQGVDLNAPGEFGWSPLHLAARKGYSDIMKLLIDAGADINQTDAAGLTALDLAAGMRYPEAARMLFKRGAIGHAASTKKFVKSLAE